MFSGGCKKGSIIPNASIPNSAEASDAFIPKTQRYNAHQDIRHQRDSFKQLPGTGHRPNFFAHFDCFGGSLISKELILELIPFSTSMLTLCLGVLGTSSILVKPLPDLLCTSLGKLDLLGVKAVATLLADLRMVARTSHDRFFARYQRTEETTVAY
jgi:hypothetical protein